jgi:hypothetical protein
MEEDALQKGKMEGEYENYPFSLVLKRKPPLITGD